MSTIIKTEFGNYDVWNGRIYEVSDELQRALRGRQINSENEMRAAIRSLREQRNQELQQAQTSAEQNRIRTQAQMEALQLQMAAQTREAVAQANAESNRRMEEQQREWQRRMEQVEQTVSSDIRSLREQQNRTIQDMEQRVRESMNRMHVQVEDRMDDIVTAVQGINRGVVELEQRVDLQFEQQQQQISSIQEQLNAMERRGEEQTKIALEWMEAVEKSNQLDRFVRDEANAVRRRMQSLWQSQASGDALAAEAKQAIIAAQELEIKCNQERLKYEQKEEMTRTMLETVLEIVNKNREVELSDDEGNPVKVENNFWSKGEYNKLRERLEALQQEINDRSQTDLSLERLDEMQQEIKKGEEEIKDITAQSVQRVMLSQARWDTVWDVVEAMQDQHWQLIETNGVKEIDYKGGEMASDFREGTFARLRNSMGEEVTVMVDPDEEQKKNTLGFHFSGKEDTTDEEKERNAAAVAEQLNQSGYELGVPRCAGQMDMSVMESAESMKQQGASERIREKERTNG